MLEVSKMTKIEFHRKVSKIGNTFYVSIPKDSVQSLKLESGQVVLVTVSVDEVAK